MRRLALATGVVLVVPRVLTCGGVFGGYVFAEFMAGKPLGKALAEFQAEGDAIFKQ